MSFAMLALLVAVGLAGPLLAGLPRLGIPLVVGEILAGVVVGRSGLDWVPTEDPTLQLLSQTGFALLMFIVGTHLPIRNTALRPALRRAVLATAVAAVLALVLAEAVATVSGLHEVPVIAVLLATSSAAVALPVMAPLGTERGDVVLTSAWVAIADVLTVLAIPLVVRQDGVASILAAMVAVTALAGLVYLVLRRLRTTDGFHGLRRQSKQRFWALDLRVNLLILFSLAAVAVRLHTSVLVAGFAAGIVLSSVGEGRRLSQQVIGLGEGFLVPLFFVTLGATIHLQALVTQPRNLVLAAALVAGTVVVHVVSATVVRLPVAAGLLASAQLGVPAAVASLGLATHLLTPGQGAAVLAAALALLAVCALGERLMQSDPAG
jgi:Kef-type K+ transport system membrane component KefB